MKPNEWRVPTIEELTTLVDYSEHSPAMSKNCPFKNASSYWSSTTYAYYPGSAWYVDFSDGYVDGYYGKYGSAMYVRCVRGGQPESFDDLKWSEGDDGYLDKQTGLIWQRNPSKKQMKWQEAMDYAKTIRG